MKTTAYPTQVLSNSTGLGLFAAEALEEGTVVERLEGRVVPYNAIGESDLRYAFEIDSGRWVVPQSSARYINHSCDPNCYISSGLDVMTLRKVSKGEELTTMYNEVALDQFMKSDAVLARWDGRRSFTCVCGSVKCIGQVDRYIVPVPNDPNSRNVAMSVVPRQGRGMFAVRCDHERALAVSAVDLGIRVRGVGRVDRTDARVKRPAVAG